MWSNNDDWTGAGKWILFYIACSLFSMGYLIYRIAVYLFTHVSITFFIPLLLLVCCNSPITEAPKDPPDEDTTTYPACTPMPYCIDPKPKAP